MTRQMPLDLTGSGGLGTDQTLKHRQLEPVPEPVPEPGSDRFRNRSGNSSIIPDGTRSLLSGDQTSGTASLAPSGSSAALTLRSQRTDREGPAGPELRPYQNAAITAVESEFEAGKLRTLLVLPTGTGKTVVFAELARRTVVADGRVLVLAHRTELLDQAARKLRDVGIRASVDQASNRASLHATVVVASVQTLRGPRLLRYPRDHFALVIVDEAHHAAAKSYQTILEHFGGVE